MNMHIISILLLIFTLSISPGLGESGPADTNLIALYAARQSVEVNFFRWNRATRQKEELLGTARLIEGKLTFSVSDKRLEMLLSGDFTTVAIVKEAGRTIEKPITYRVGTIEHLQNAVSHCKDIGCIAEVRVPSPS